MDIEFHYYMTYLIAARAGFAPADAAIVAQSAQEVDDNHILIRVSRSTPFAYMGTISQTMDILRPLHNEKIYPIFLFIPGDPNLPSTKRKDGLTSPWVTTPNSDLANELFETALRSGDLYRIGASAHAYVDTWAHQNFLGMDDAFNKMPISSFGQMLQTMVTRMQIGHALAGHLPDIPGLIWTDGRLEVSKIDNTDRFMDAAAHLFRKLALYRNHQIAEATVTSEITNLIADLRSDIGASSTNSCALDPARIMRYRARPLRSEYGGTAIPDYQEGKWADEAFVEQRAGLLQRLAIYAQKRAGVFGDALGFGTAIACTWKDPEHRSDTHWYRFQEAVKTHLNECWQLLVRRFPGIA